MCGSSSSGGSGYGYGRKESSSYAGTASGKSAAPAVGSKQSTESTNKRFRVNDRVQALTDVASYGAPGRVTQIQDSQIYVCFVRTDKRVGSTPDGWYNERFFGMINRPVGSVVDQLKQIQGPKRPAPASPMSKGMKGCG